MLSSLGSEFLCITLCCFPVLPALQDPVCLAQAQGEISAFLFSKYFLHMTLLLWLRLPFITLAVKDHLGIGTY